VKVRDWPREVDLAITFWATFQLEGVKVKRQGLATIESEEVTTLTTTLEVGWVRRLTGIETPVWSVVVSLWGDTIAGLTQVLR